MDKKENGWARARYEFQREGATLYLKNRGEDSKVHGSANVNGQVYSKAEAQAQHAYRQTVLCLTT